MKKKKKFIPYYRRIKNYYRIKNRLKFHFLKFSKIFVKKFFYKIILYKKKRINRFNFLFEQLQYSRFFIFRLNSIFKKKKKKKRKKKYLNKFKFLKAFLKKKYLKYFSFFYFKFIFLNNILLKKKRVKKNLILKNFLMLNNKKKKINKLELFDFFSFIIKKNYYSLLNLKINNNIYNLYSLSNTFLKIKNKIFYILFYILSVFYKKNYYLKDNNYYLLNNNSFYNFIYLNNNNAFLLNIFKYFL
jgi:hypothetical protein